MGEFFANMSSTRAVILGLLFLAAGLGWLVLSQGKDLDELTRQRNVSGPRVVTEIMELSHRYDQLDGQFSRDGLLGIENPATYIRQVATQSEVSIGQVDVQPSEQAVGGGIVDKTFGIDPSDRQRSYTRLQIANFLYRLEEKTLKAKVTSLRLTPQGRPKPEDYLTDQWTFSATITSREATDEQPR